MKKVLFLSLALMTVFALAGCKEKNSYVGLDTEVAGQVDLLLWSGSGEYYEDIGKQDIAVADLTAQNDASAYYVAKEFKKIYPNVVVNVLAMAGGPNDGGRIWAQELENYQNTYGAHPSIWATVDLPGECMN